MKVGFANSRLEQFDESKAGRYLVREGNKHRIVYLLLDKIPIPNSVEIQAVYKQPRNSYVTFRNLVLLFHPDPDITLKKHPILVRYVADLDTQDQPYVKLSVDNDRVFADFSQLRPVKW